MYPEQCYAGYFAPGFDTPKRKTAATHGINLFCD
jgi:hypothetical protein